MDKVVSIYDYKRFFCICAAGPASAACPAAPAGSAADRSSGSGMLFPDLPIPGFVPCLLFRVLFDFRIRTSRTGVFPFAPAVPGLTGFLSPVRSDLTVGPLEYLFEFLFGSGFSLFIITGKDPCTRSAQNIRTSVSVSVRTVRTADLP